MRAVVHDTYGPPDVLRLEELAQPFPKDDEVLVRVHATTVNRTDTGLRGGTPFAARFVSGLRRPRRRILGTEFAGEVAGAGAAVTEFQDRRSRLWVESVEVRYARGVRVRSGKCPDRRHA